MRRIVDYGMSEEVGLLAFRFIAWVFVTSQVVFYREGVRKFCEIISYPYPC